MINLFQPSIGEEALVEMKNVFESNWLGRGKKSSHFEELLSEYFGVSKEIIGTNSCCTDSIFSSIKLLALGPDDLVVTIPTNSFRRLVALFLRLEQNWQLLTLKKMEILILKKYLNIF